LARVREGDPNDKMLSMMHLDNPMLDWVKLAEGRGGPATRATTAEEFHHQFEAAMSTKGPRLIEARIVQNLVGADTRRETVSDLLYEVKGRVAIITLNRPEKLNAFTGSMIEARPTDTRAWRTSRLLRCCMKGPLHLEGP